MDKTGEKNKIKWIFEIFEKKSTAERWAFLYIKEKGRRKIKKNMMQIYKKKKRKKKKSIKLLDSRWHIVFLSHSFPRWRVESIDDINEW